MTDFNTLHADELAALLLTGDKLRRVIVLAGDAELRMLSPTLTASDDGVLAINVEQPAAVWALELLVSAAGVDGWPEGWGAVKDAAVDALIKAGKLPTIGAKLARAGFAVADTGGGCTAWRAELDNGAYILVTDSDGAGHKLADGDAVVVGVYGEDDNPITTGFAPAISAGSTD